MRASGYLSHLEARFRFGWWARFRLDRHPSFYLSHSQFGEDMLLRVLLRDRKRGFYVDLGAHHPVYYSTTYRFYRLGWSGLNVDALPKSMDAFRSLRPRDVNVEACLGRKDGERAVLRVFEQTALSTVKPSPGEQVPPAREILMETLSLATLFRIHLPQGQRIDFMSVDLEGSEEAVLSGNDWTCFRPEYLVVEQHGTLADALSSRLFGMLRGLAYNLIGKLGPSYVFGPAEG